MTVAWRDGVQSRSRRPPPSSPIFHSLTLPASSPTPLLARATQVGEVAIVRVEQLAPFPFDLVCREIRRYPNAQLLWCQEEPMNMGAYMHVQPRFDTCLREEGKPMMGRCVGAVGAVAGCGGKWGGAGWAGVGCWGGAGWGGVEWGWAGEERQSSGCAACCRAWAGVGGREGDKHRSTGLGVPPRWLSLWHDT